jgi:hypothetical protein
LVPERSGPLLWARRLFITLPGVTPIREEVSVDKLALQLVVRILEADPDPYVPVERLWQTLHQEGLALDLDLQPFEDELQADNRFEFTQAPALPPAGAGEGQSTEDVGQELSALGLYSGRRVKLASRKVTSDDVLAGLVHNLELVNQALLRAWDNRPRGDPEAEAMLVEAMAKAEKLGKEIREVIDARQGRSPEEETS